MVFDRGVIGYNVFHWYVREWSGILQLVFADVKGKIYNFPGLRPCGMKAGHFFSLEDAPLLKLPDFSELFMLPGRSPVGLDLKSGAPVVLESDPYSKSKEPCFPVAAFIPPGYTLTHNTAYTENSGAPFLPLFAYGACLFHKGDFYVAAMRVDADSRHDERLMDPDEIKRNIKEYEKLFPGNRLIPHLANCATVNACANAKNFFLGRYEAPIPTSPVCNAQCQGCISLQPDSAGIPSTQPRITFTPTPEEIAEITLHHFDREKEPIVSFGQGCEGEPSLAVDTIEKAIKLIRQKTSKGTININSNASRPQNLNRLFEAGLTNVRVSTNSVREPYYSRYYQPKGYSFKEVTQSVDIAKKHGGFVSLNYLSMPGFTDTEGEVNALKDFIASHGVDMIQWRNLNYDPMQYFRNLQVWPVAAEMLGMDRAMKSVQKDSPRLRMGYFNPKVHA